MLLTQANFKNLRMRLFGYIILVILITSCYKNKKANDVEKKQDIEQIKNKNIDDLEKKVLNYVPTDIDISRLDLLENFDIKYIFNNDEYSDNKKYKISSLILLKYYLYHLKNCNQGYDIKQMRNKNAKIVIDYFLDKNNVDLSKEFINSSVAFNILKKDKSITDKDILKIISEIKHESNRIIKQTEDIIDDDTK